MWARKHGRAPRKGQVSGSRTGSETGIGETGGRGTVKGAIRLLSSRDTLAPATQVSTLTSLAISASTSALSTAVQPHYHRLPLYRPRRGRTPSRPSHPSPSTGRLAGRTGLALRAPDGPAGWGAGNAGMESGEGGTSGNGLRPTANPLLEAITDLVNLLLSGEVPQFVRASLFGGSITALAKKGGGVRPIAVCYTWGRLVGKVVCRLVSPRAAALLAPRQLGFGVTGGTEATVHACRR